MPFYWCNNDQPVMRGGRPTPPYLPGNLHFTGNKKYSYGAVVTIPTGHENSFEFTYWRKQGFGTSVLGSTETYNFFGDNFAPSDSVLTRYTVQSMKLSWDYLTFPYPSNSAKFRLKTLYQIQYVSVGTSFDAPADPDAIPTSGNKDMIFPTLGVGLEYHPSRHFRLEMKASGFGLVASRRYLGRAGLGGGALWTLRIFPEREGVSLQNLAPGRSVFYGNPARATGRHSLHV